MNKSRLFNLLPSFAEVSNDLLLDRFLSYTAEKNLTLYPAQEEAILQLFAGQNVILNTPTGSGKSLVALGLHFHSLALGRRSVYTCPIKALVNEKFLQLCREFGPEQVGMATGDGTVNRDAPILCCTAEILSNLALREGEFTPFDDIVMDEFHYYSDRERGAAWQIPLLTLTRARFLLMSATLGEMSTFAERLTELNQRETSIVSGSERPVPLKFEYRSTPLHETVKDLIEQNSAPVYLVCFSQREAAEQAQNLLSVDFTPKEVKKQIAERLYGARFQSPYGKEIGKFLKHGIGVHHAGLLPKYRLLVERLAQDGLLKVICGTDTLGVGVNIPIRTVLFTKLCKFDGEKTTILSVRDFQQISGRAGRKGFDDSGRVVAQAPEHVIENLRLEMKAKADPAKAKKIVKVKPPVKGFVMWSEETFQKLIKSQPEKLESRFQVTHGILLNVLARSFEDGCFAMRRLIKSTHETPASQRRHLKDAWTLFRSLHERKIIEIRPRSEWGSGVSKIRVHADLQEDFSLNHSLALWLIDTLEKLDSEAESYALDVLTLVEAVLESPDLIIRKQTDRAREHLFHELKAAGVEFDERQEKLEAVEHPKPLRDFIYTTFNLFSDAHPWVGTENIRPKSIAREMFEKYMSFAEYVREYGLERAEGTLLRYLTETLRFLTQTVPSRYKNDEVLDIIEYIGEMVRGIDSTLLDEWEKIKNPATPAVVKLNESTQNKNNLTETLDARKAELSLQRRRLSHEAFRFLRALAVDDYLSAFEILVEWSDDPIPVDTDGVAWSETRLRDVIALYRADNYQGIRTDLYARHVRWQKVSAVSEGKYTLQVRLVDTAGDADNADRESGDWVLNLRGENKEIGLEGIGPLT